MSRTAAENPLELGTKSIGALLKQYAVPGIIAMTATSLYNMVDSIYIGHLPEVGAYALSAIGICNPIMNLGAAVGTLVGVGASTVMSILLGQKNIRNAQKVLSNEITLNLILGSIFTALILIWEEPVLYFFGASEATMEYAKQYLTVIMAGNVISHMYFGLNGLIRAGGSPKTAMGLTLFTVTLNTILDPLFIFTFKMGVQGAALVTVLSQLIALCYTFWYFSRKDRTVHFGDRILEIDWKIAKTSLSIGLGPFLMNSAACIVNLFINQQLRKYGGDLAIGAYSIANRISFLFLMIVFGFNQGMQPIAGYNYGARKYARVRKVYLLTAAWASGVCLFGFILSEFFPVAAVRIFTNDATLLEFASKGLRLMNISFIVVGMQMVSTNFFQCLGMVKKSIFLSLTRQLLFLVPMIYLLPIWLGVKGVWYSFAISDALAFFITGIMIIGLMRKFGRLSDGDEPTILGSTI